MLLDLVVLTTGAVAARLGEHPTDHPGRRAGALEFLVAGLVASFQEGAGCRGEFLNLGVDEQLDHI